MVTVVMPEERSIMGLGEDRDADAFAQADEPDTPRGTNFGTFAILAVIALVVMIGAYFVPKPGQSPTSATAVQVSAAPGGKPPAVGEPAHDFTGRTIDGDQVSLSQFRGKPVWLTFGATWCAPCRVEAPDIQAAFERARTNGTTVLAVYLSEDAATVREYTERVGMTYVHVPDSATAIASSYQTVGIPSHFFIDRSGILRKIHVGILTPAQMDAALREIA